MIDQVRQDAITSAKAFIENPDVSKLGGCMLSINQYYNYVKYTPESFSPTDRSGFALSIGSIKVGDVLKPRTFVATNGFEYTLSGEVKSIECFTDILSGNQYLFYRIVTGEDTLTLDSGFILDVLEISHDSRDSLTLIKTLLEAFCNHPFGGLAKNIISEIKKYLKDMEGV